MWPVGLKPDNPEGSHSPQNVCCIEMILKSQNVNKIMYGLYVTT